MGTTENIEKNFRELIDALRKCKSNCPWTRKQTPETYAHQIVGEVEEVMEAIKKGDSQNLKEELGDVLWDVLMVAHLAEDKGLFKVEEIITNVIEKMKRRKPYVFEGKEVTVEEAKRIWVEVKEREKRKSLPG